MSLLVIGVYICKFSQLSDLVCVFISQSVVVVKKIFLRLMSNSPSKNQCVLKSEKWFLKSLFMATFYYIPFNVSIMYMNRMVITQGHSY